MPDAIQASLPVIAGIRYLNSAPYFAPLALGVVASRFAVELMAPSDANRAVVEGRAVAGLISTAAWHHHRGDLVRLPGFEIASCGAVDSILLASPHDLEQVRRVHVTMESETSIALLRILLARRGLTPEFRSSADPLVDLASDPIAAAALLIGDAALAVDRAAIPTWDLGLWWWEETGLPMVYAVLAARRDAAEWHEEIAQTLANALAWSRQNLDAVVAEWYDRARDRERRAFKSRAPSAALRYLVQLDDARAARDLEAGLLMFTRELDGLRDKQ